jgi:hypothetical protein
MASEDTQSFSEAWLLQTCNASSLDSVRSINLWAKSLSDADVSSVLGKCQNLEVASLSLNRISQLGAFSRMRCLKELFLRKNNVADINQVWHLAVRGHSNACFELCFVQQVSATHDAETATESTLAK